MQSMHAVAYWGFSVVMLLSGIFFVAVLKNLVLTQYIFSRIRLCKDANGRGLPEEEQEFGRFPLAILEYL
jgi:hypothetical protein